MIGVAGSASVAAHSASTTDWSTTAGQQPALAGVAAEDVGEPRGDHDPEAVVLQRPHGVLARRPGAEVRTGDQDRGPGPRRVVEHEVGVGAPGREQRVLVPVAGDPLEVLGRDDLVGVDVAGPQRQGGARCGR